MILYHSSIKVLKVYNVANNMQYKGEKFPIPEPIKCVANKNEYEYRRTSVV